MATEDLLTKNTDFHFECCTTFWNEILEMFIVEVLKADASVGFKQRFRMAVDEIKRRVENTSQFDIKTRTKFMLQDLLEKYETLMTEKKVELGLERSAA
jgi:hypothetical protein